MRENTVRLSVDVSVKQHIALKTRAAKKGMTIREYILESLTFSEEKEEEALVEDLDKDIFHSCFEKLRKTKWQLARNLSKL